MAITDIANNLGNNTDDRPWRTCAVCHELSNLPTEQAAALRDLLAGNVRYNDLAELLAADPDYPLQLDAGTLSRHARGRCAAREKLRAS